MSTDARFLWLPPEDPPTPAHVRPAPGPARPERPATPVGPRRAPDEVELGVLFAWAGALLTVVVLWAGALALVALVLALRAVG